MSWELRYGTYKKTELIGTYEDEMDARAAMVKYLTSHNISPHYYQYTGDVNNYQVDFGNWTEFFFFKNIEEIQMFPNKNKERIENSMEKIYIVAYEMPDWPTDHYAFKDRAAAHNKVMAIFGDYLAAHMSEGIFESDDAKIEFFNRFTFDYDDDTGYINLITIKEDEGQYEEIYIEEVELQ